MHIMQHPYFIRIYNWKCSLHLSLSLLLPPSFSLSLSLSVYLCLSSCERHIAFIICMAYRTCKCWQNFGRVPALFLPIHPKIPDGTGHEPPPSPTSLPPPPPPVVCNHQASQHPSILALPHQHYPYIPAAASPSAQPSDISQLTESCRRWWALR